MYLWPGGVRGAREGGGGGCLLPALHPSFLDPRTSICTRGAIRTLAGRDSMYFPLSSPACTPSHCSPPVPQDFDAEEGEALEEEHEAETELLDALGSCITTAMRLYSVSAAGFLKGMWLCCRGTGWLWGAAAAPGRSSSRCALPCAA